MFQTWFTWCASKLTSGARYTKLRAHLKDFDKLEFASIQEGMYILIDFLRIPVCASKMTHFCYYFAFLIWADQVMKVALFAIFDDQ